jgi:hypothetical protein
MLVIESNQCRCGVPKTHTSWLVHPAILAITAFFGAGLVYASITDTCGMDLLLGRMS